jgi:hypothetical protein
MEELLGQWIGDLRGTAMGSVYAVVTDDAGRKGIELKVNVGGTVATLRGHLVQTDGVTSVELTADLPADAPNPVGSSNIVLDTILPNRLAGRWTTTTGHAGTINLVRSDTAQPPATQIAPPPSQPPKPIEIVAREGRLANLTLYRSELETIVAKIKLLVGGSNDVVIATTIDGGKQIRQFSADFFARRDLPRHVTSINLSLNDGRQGIQSNVIVNLSDKFESTFFIQSDDALWVSGGFAELEGFFRRYTNPISVFIQKHGLNVNGIMLITVIALLPDLPLSSRFIVLVLTFIVVSGLLYLHRRLTSTVVYLDAKAERGFFSKFLPSLVSALTAAAFIAFVGWGSTGRRLSQTCRSGLGFIGSRGFIRDIRPRR